ncbi:uncharacterized protein LOC111783708 isoform X2 [Cucurbita pepo subsp. pepo]|uniref:uncharacterized protein LOC111783708 isoform X2 n=1 Tax=Cucurbita pepo subsp. pepo TaxID=3664 RepID=UPI000C9D8967|nr:uncharacterized protein LOC111783708 isoform X2 [Cucurbita pepo subsp. pepo]
MAMKPRRKFLHLYAEEALCFSAFLLSLFIYFSAFNLSLSTLFRHTTFWFCLSNTLIFIIAAHSRAFSPPPTFNSAAVIIPTPPQNNFNSGNPTENHQQQQIPLPTEISINNSRKSYDPSKSEKAMRRVAKETKMAMRRSKTMTRNEKEETKNELAEMSNEELNKRVEEFIERFNRQMRLQAIGDSNEE